MQGSARIDELRQKFHENPRRYFAPLANEYRKAGDPEQAIAICRAHLAQQPGHMSGHVVYAQSLYDAGRVDESRVVFEKALSLDPDNAIVLRQLGDISRQRGDSPEARHWYSRALEADPHNREIAAYIAELTEPLTESELSPEGEAATGDEPVVEEHVAAEPVIDEPVPAEPVIDEPVAAEPVIDEPVVAQTAIDETAADEVTASSEAHEPAVPEPEVPTDATPLAWELADEVRDDEHDLASSSTDIEVPLAAPAHEPEVGAPADESVDESDSADVTAIPARSASPFVTRTMADLYARQGYHEQALEVYRELATASPDDPELADRVRELSAISEASVTPQSVDDAANEFSEPVDQENDLGFHPPEEEVVAAPDTEEVTASRHFTDTELGVGDQWDTDPWGAGFSSDDADMVPFDFSPSNAAPELSDELQLDTPAGLEEVTSPTIEPHGTAELAELAPEPEIQVETDSAPIVEAPLEPESAAKHPPIAEPDFAEPYFAEPDLSSASVPLGVLNDAREEIFSEEIFTVAAESGAPDGDVSAALPEDAVVEDGVVAYSPQTPDEKDLAHYTPTGPTVREFFATLGAYRPPVQDPQQSFTARAAIPEIGKAELDESVTDEIWSPAAPESPDGPARQSDAFPLASDAFANLFPDSPISEEDSKAAFALSGALSSQPTAMPRVTPPKPVAPVVPGQTAPASGAQESEEDILRFREWLDGLADS